MYFSDYCSPRYESENNKLSVFIVSSYGNKQVIHPYVLIDIYLNKYMSAFDP